MDTYIPVASVWGLVALWLADEEFLPFDYVSYAKELQVYIHHSNFVSLSIMKAN